MPPIDIDENESSEDEENAIPFRASTAKKAESINEEEEVEEEGDEDEDEDEYVVEKIISHGWDENENQYTYKVRWQGYPKESDHTWEPVRNLETAMEILEEYWNSIGGEPAPPGPPPKKRGPKSGSKKRPLEDSNDSKRASTGRGRKKQHTAVRDDDDDDNDSESIVIDIPRKTKYPPAKDWDRYIAAVRTIEESVNKMGNKDRWGMVAWDNGELTRHRLALLHEKAPQSMLRFYEANLVFKTTDVDNDANGEVTFLGD